MTHIERELTGDALVADIEAADPGNGLVLWWLGQSAFLVKSAAGRVLFDPHLAFSLAHPRADTDEARVRQTRPVVEPGSLTSIDVVTVNCHHADLMDAETLSAVFNANPKAVLVVPEANRKFVAERLGCHPSWPWGLNEGESVSFGEITVLAVSAAQNTINADAADRCHNVGYVVWFGNMKVFHGGDTLRCPKLVELLRPLAIDVALLPFDRKRPDRRAAGNLAGDEIAQLAHDIDARLVVPYCRELFGNASLARFEKTCEQLGQSYKTLRCGERLWVEP